jgi:hypothetical protein
MAPTRTASQGFESAPTAANRNFTFAGPYPHNASASGATSPSSTNSNVSHTSSASNTFDVDDFSHAHALTTQQPHATLHVDINPLTPPSVTSAEIYTSPAQSRGVLPPPHAHLQAAAAHSHLGVGSASSASSVHHAHMTPQSPSIPEGEESNVEQDESNSIQISLEPTHDGPFSSTNFQTYIPPYAKTTSLPVTSGSQRHSMPLPPSSSHAHPASGGKLPLVHEAGMMPPLGARRKTDQQYSASVDDLSRMVPPASQTPVVSARLYPPAPQSSPHGANPHSSGSFSATSSPAVHTRNSSSMSDVGPSASVRYPSSADNTPHGAPRNLTPSAQSHQRANSVFVHGSAASSSDGSEPETEEKRKARLEAAERARVQKKTDAAKAAKEAAKACEDSIMAKFSL